MDATAKEAALEGQLRSLGSARVAFSGGVDSTYLLAIAHRVLGAACEAVTADSPSLPREALAWAQDFCQGLGIRHRLIATDEFARPAYLANDGERCYHCKAALLDGLALLDGQGPVLIGAIADDLADWRPGMRAAAERGARFPLADLGFSKAEVRERSRLAGIPGHDRPAQPCLSSRLPYGEPVTVEGLRMIEEAEAALRHLGFATCRARHHRIGAEAAPKGWLCRIEVPDAEIPRLAELRATVVPALKRIGYASVCVDLAGFRSGGFNDLIRPGA